MNAPARPVQPRALKQRVRALQSLLWLWPTLPVLEAAHKLSVESAQSGRTLIFDCEYAPIKKEAQA